MLGSFYCRAGDFEPGARHLKQASGRAPGRPRGRQPISRAALAKIGDYARTWSTSSRRPLAASDPTMGLLSAARVRRPKYRRFHDRRRLLREGRAPQCPTDWESWNNLGNARRELGDFDGAVEALRRSVDLNPQAAPSRFNYATALEQAGKFRGRRARASPNGGGLSERREAVARTLRASEAAISRRGGAECARGGGSARAERSRTRPRPREPQPHPASPCAVGAGVSPRDRDRSRRTCSAFLGVATVFDQTNRTDELAALVKEARARGHRCRGAELRQGVRSPPRQALRRRARGAQPGARPSRDRAQAAIAGAAPRRHRAATTRHSRRSSG